MKLIQNTHSKARASILLDHIDSETDKTLLRQLAGKYNLLVGLPAGYAGPIARVVNRQNADRVKGSLGKTEFLAISGNITEPVLFTGFMVDQLSLAGDVVAPNITNGRLNRDAIQEANVPRGTVEHLRSYVAGKTSVNAHKIALLLRNEADDTIIGELEFILPTIGARLAIAFRAFQTMTGALGTAA